MFNELEISTIKKLAESKGLGMDVLGGAISIMKQDGHHVREIALVRKPVGKSTKWTIEGIKFLLRSF